jgi:putative transposase
MSIAVSSYRYSARRLEESLREKLLRVAREKPCYGYRRLQVLVEREANEWTITDCGGLYRDAGLYLKRKKAGTACALARRGLR